MNKITYSLSKDLLSDTFPMHSNFHTFEWLDLIHCTNIKFLDEITTNAI